MIAKFVVIFAITFAVCNAGVLPLAAAPAALVAQPAPVAVAAPAAYAVAPYASSYSAHSINHAVATPVFASAPVVAPLAAPAPLLAAPAARYFSSPYSYFL